MASLELLVVLADFPAITLREKLLLAEKLDNIEDIEVISTIEGLSFLIGRALKKAPPSRDALRSLSERRVRTMGRYGMRFASYYMDEYPPLLREIYDPPFGIFYRGALPDASKPLVSIVGTRSPTGDGLQAAYSLAEDLGKNGVSVVSGLAFGVDAAAHRGNIAGGAPTTAVLACGVDILYPRGNATLAGKLLEAGGCILSEYPPGTEPLKFRFPRRNRIISGLSRSVVVVEAPEKSGALITADFALEQGRDLLVHAATLNSKRNAGARKLHDEGAHAVASASDVFASWRCA